MRERPQARIWLATGGLLVALLIGGTLQVVAQESAWEQSMAHGAQAFAQGQEAAAEKLYPAALDEVESLGSDDPRVVATLNALALLYHAQRKYVQA